jgi:4-hydroxyphenylacetate 3-monooxygenase
VNDNKPMATQRLRTGADFVSDLRNRPRTVYVDGERVTNVAEHPAFRGGARSIARLFDFAAAPENRETMTFVPTDGGGRAWR